MDSALHVLPPAALLYTIPDDEFERALATFRAELSELHTADEFLAQVELHSAHPAWQVRYSLVEAAETWADNPAVRTYVANQTHDSVDSVAFVAIALCGKLRLSEGVSHLVRISGWPSIFQQPEYLRKPVGIGAAKTKSALVAIFGSKQPERLRELEHEYLEPYRAVLKRRKLVADRSNMMLIPSGEFSFGTDDDEQFRVYYKDFLPLQRAHLEAYYIDRVPVTNAEYRVFLADVNSGKGHRQCHSDEPEGKDHTPAHWRDSRFAADDMPVTGVDWYDAHAFASWAGKQLPSELQWEKAARGPDGRRYPWGDDWRDGAANSFLTSFGFDPATVVAWEEELQSYSPVTPPRPVWPVGTRLEAESVYGVNDMAGNVWEWTRTNFYTKRQMDPFFKRRRVVEFMNRPDAFAVIRGGCFTSLPEMLRTYYRGKDLLTDRHCEIGFRCVVEAEVS